MQVAMYVLKKYTERIDSGRVAGEAGRWGGSGCQRKVRGFSEDLLAVGQMPAGSWPCTHLREELSKEREQHVQIPRQKLG